MRKVDPLTGARCTIKALEDKSMGNEWWRKGYLRDKFDDIIVDTIMTCFDTGLPETGILRNGYWTIVEQYDAPENAVIGHKKWFESMKSDPTKRLIDINLWGG